MQIENRTPATAPLTSQAENQTDIVAKLEALVEIGPVVEIGRKHWGFTSKGCLFIEFADGIFRVAVGPSKDRKEPKTLGASFLQATGEGSTTWKRDVLIYEVRQGPEADKIVASIRSLVNQACEHNFK